MAAAAVAAAAAAAAVAAAAAAAAAAAMRATNSSGVSTFLLQTSIYIQPHKQKSNGGRSGHSNISIPLTMQD